ncbi:MAG: chemotaxis protein CheA, partial [Desulfurivibrio sp.]
MSQDKKTVSEILDEMALRILMVEPGDLSVVGELLGAAEELLASEGDTIHLPVLHGMAAAFKSALERMIMGELPDTAENYELLGRAITQMQETVRKGGEMDEAGIAAFARHMSDVGLPLAATELSGGIAANEEEPATESAPEPPPPVDADASEDEAAVPDFLQDKELLGGFIDEAFEHLEGIEVNVLELEQNPDDQDIINNIFRPFHTIKGVSGFLNLKTINKLAHATENLLDDVRNGKRPMDSDVIDLVLTVGDLLKEMVENIKDVLDRGPACYREFDISEQVDRILALQNGEVTASPPPVVPVVSADAPAAPVVQSTPEPVAAARSVAPVQRPVGGNGNGSEAPDPAPKKKMGASIKVDVEKLDALVNAVGELVIMQSLVRQNPLISKIADPKLIKDFSQLGRITSELQRTAMSMRMVPIKQTFDKMIRLVRDLSKKTGKEVDLVMEGAETEIDRNMVDSIYDPLVHMMRNSVDHGIQTPEERAAHGKSPTGKVHLRAYQKGGNMVIEIEDDGEGLPAGKIRSKAESRGLIRPGDTLTDFELYNLIFLPGFSTADQITDVSGRGVGMDVVKKGVEKLRGKVEVHSQPGKGSLFVIRLPLTLAIIDGIIVRVGSERYIIPTIAIQESMKPERKNYNTVHGRGESLLTRGNLVPIIRLYQLFGVEPSHTDPCEAIVVVVENEGRQRALMVDELLGKEEVVIKNLGGMQDVRGVAGGTILGDGRVGLILDLAGIISD